MKISKQQYLVSLLLSCACLAPGFANAFNWNNLWLRPDQQGAQALASGKAEQAAQLFTQPEWQAAARYRAGQYQQAIALWTPINTSDAHYNRGNALAHLGDYQAAIAAYEQALKLNPDHKDAKFNKELLQKLSNQQSTSKDQPSSSADKQTLQEQANDNNSSEADVNSKDNSQTNDPHATAKQQEKDRQEQTAQMNSKQQALQQWLQQIPDDPGGLLRQKFLRDYRKAQTQ